MRHLGLVTLLALLASPAEAAGARGAGIPYVVDPVTKRIYQYCRNNARCIAAQHQGIRMFLREVTRQPRPSQARVQRCTRQATAKGLTDWPKAARCLR